ncbi:hypothetical protein PFDG_03433 [Plasmodium falciparum Dd2]|uniref:Uncharacterized protein n=1 Tax=Plasmodium falciparum (isolate Dd2) TaxID=57267 RepID=A0A0L7M3A4_PLAF4|nr:hypothetical protein PFDG_03433 [Plasmodium falciparum Dd2]
MNKSATSVFHYLTENRKHDTMNIRVTKNDITLLGESGNN